MSDVPNVLIAHIPASGRIDRVQITEEGVVLHFASGPVELRHHHTKDCCELVYADWTAVGDHLKPLLREYGWNGLAIKGVPDMGFLLVFGDPVMPLKVFVPCRNEQNGYYSSDLELVLEHDGVATGYNLQGYIKDLIG